LQIQEGATTRAADRLNEARQKLLDTQIHQKELALEQKRLEDSPPAADPQEQSDLLDKLTHVKSDLEVTGHAAQQRQTAAIQAEQQLRDEQDKLNALENQLDELTGSTANSNGKPADNRP
jgi:chromosome segregation ATPase